MSDHASLNLATVVRLSFPAKRGKASSEFLGHSSRLLSMYNRRPPWVLTVLIDSFPLFDP